ncbi:sulfatase-like hydrolase/transferase [Rhizobium halophilum]|uniref:sulfatase-like hydrolase/transferase n=1 Tax=Rhizobium halophilum TaxID=2846852 RepID=UPI001EFC4503|nr:sulfatase-like hydrolase/transferase [Rhizobium halophilum]MCF6368021.1 sulfatase [Rhizobium halophilum]
MPGTDLRKIFRISIAVLTCSIVLALPSNPAVFNTVPEIRFPLEVLPLILLCIFLPVPAFFLVRVTATLLLGVLLFLKLADIGTGLAFQRPFNPYLDFKIIVDGWNLLSGSIGGTGAVAYAGAAIALLIIVCLVFFWSLGGFRDLSPKIIRRLAVTAVGALAFGSLMLTLAPGIVPVSANAGPYISNRVSMIRQSIADLSAFEQELKVDPIANVAQDELLASLAGTDIVIIFVESYGRTAIEDDRYSPTIEVRLQQVERQVHDAGLAIRSGWLTSPTVGGLSWLAHGALLSGLWTDTQARYDRMIASKRQSLNSLFREAGWRTTAIMPAITMDWPEGGYFGYDSIRDAAGLGYLGKPFNWVTMPDQYTLSAFERLERRDANAPVMAEIALISSHAPWTPVPTLIEWSRIGDGRVFNVQAERGDPPSVVWSDPSRVRQQYLASIDYVLQTLGSYIEIHGDSTLFVILGDHQPAAIITGEDASRDVPIHIIGSSDLVKRTEAWGWTEGMLPSSASPSMRMDRFRDAFVRAFSIIDAQ